jgi:hypothetical protein
LKRDRRREIDVGNLPLIPFRYLELLRRSWRRHGFVGDEWPLTSRRTSRFAPRLLAHANLVGERQRLNDGFSKR